MLYVINENENIYDVAIKLYGDPVFALQIVIDNSDVINLATVNISGIEINYDETVKQSLSRFLEISDPVISDFVYEYTVKKGQSIYDLAIMWGYGIENVVEFLQDININDIEESIVNRTINVTKTKTNLSDYINLQNKVLSTDISLSVNGILTDDGDPLLDDDGFWLNVD